MLNSDEIAGRLRDTEDKLDSLEREHSDLRIVLAQLLSKIDATAAYYEQRVDLIYRRVNVALREMLGYGNVDSISDQEAEAVLAKVMRSFDIPFSVSDQLKSAVSGNLRPGSIASPLTVHGFRVNRRRARETGEGIELYGNEDGIAVYGPYKLLKPGNYHVTAALSRLGPSNTPTSGRLVMDIFGSEKQSVVAVGDSMPDSSDTSCELPLSFNWSGGAIEIRVSNNSGDRWLLEGFNLSVN